MESQEQEREERLRMKAWSRRAKMRRLLEMEREQQAADAGANGKVRRLLDHDTESQHILGLLQVRQKKKKGEGRRVNSLSTELGPILAVCPLPADMISTADAHTPLPSLVSAQCTNTVSGQTRKRKEKEFNADILSLHDPDLAQSNMAFPPPLVKVSPRHTSPSIEDSALHAMLYMPIASSTY